MQFNKSIIGYLSGKTESSKLGSNPVGASLLAMTSVWSADSFDRAHIHFFGNGHLGFRPYGESLGRAPSNQGLLPLSFGASLVLGMPSLRSCSVGPPRSAIHGRARLTRHPCRVAHYAEPPLGLSRGRAPPKPKRGGLRADLTLRSARIPNCRSRLAGEGVLMVAARFKAAFAVSQLTPPVLIPQ